MNSKTPPKYQEQLLFRNIYEDGGFTPELNAPSQGKFSLRPNPESPPTSKQVPRPRQTQTPQKTPPQPLQQREVASQPQPIPNQALFYGPAPYQIISYQPQLIHFCPQPHAGKLFQADFNGILREVSQQPFPSSQFPQNINIHQRDTDLASDSPPKKRKKKSNSEPQDIPKPPQVQLNSFEQIIQGIELMLATYLQSLQNGDLQTANTCWNELTKLHQQKSELVNQTMAQLQHASVPPIAQQPPNGSPDSINSTTPALPTKQPPLSYSTPPSPMALPPTPIFPVPESQEIASSEPFSDTLWSDRLMQFWTQQLPTDNSTPQDPGSLSDIPLPTPINISDTIPTQSPLDFPQDDKVAFVLQNLNVNEKNSPRSILAETSDLLRYGTASTHNCSAVCHFLIAQQRYKLRVGYMGRPPHPSIDLNGIIQPLKLALNIHNDSIQGNLSDTLTEAQLVEANKIKTAVLTLQAQDPELYSDEFSSDQAASSLDSSFDPNDAPPVT